MEVPREINESKIEEKDKKEIKLPNKPIQINEDGSIEIVKKSDFVKQVKSSKYYALTKEERLWLEQDILNNNEYVFNQKHIIAFYLMTYAGLRRDEVVQCRKSWLEPSQMDINGHVKNILKINIPYKDNDIRKGGNWKWKAKTRNSERTTIILEDHIAMYVKSYFDANKNGIGISADYLYAVVAGKTKQHRFSFKNRLQNMPYLSKSEKERLMNISPHSLRSTYAFYLKEEYNFPNDIIKDLLGHGDSRIIEKHYFQRTSQGLELSIKNYLKK